MARTIHLGLSLSTVVSTLAFAYVVYLLGVVINRLYLSPLAKFPGPRLAAATSWYEFYFDWWLQGRYILEIEKMHRKYGQYTRFSLVVRASPVGNTVEH